MHTVVLRFVLLWLHLGFLVDSFDAFTLISQGCLKGTRAVTLCVYTLICNPLWLWLHQLTHRGWVTHICVSKLTTIGSDNGLLLGRRQAIISTNSRILLIGPLGTNFNEMLIKIPTFTFKKMSLKMLSGKWRPFCLNLNVYFDSDSDSGNSCGSAVIPKDTCKIDYRL